MKTKITYLGGPTYLLEVGKFRLLTDPGFDPKGTERSEGPGHDLKKIMSPPVPVEKIGRIDAILLSHQQHYDNLDNAGRSLIPQAGRVLTTKESAEVLGGKAEGMAPWETNFPLSSLWSPRRRTRFVDHRGLSARQIRLKRVWGTDRTLQSGRHTCSSI